MARSKKDSEAIARDIKANPPQMKTLERENFTISELLGELIEQRKLSYEDVGNLMGMSGYGVGRLMRHDVENADVNKIIELCHNLKWPIQKVVYANAISAIKPDKMAVLDQKMLTEQRQEEPPHAPGYLKIYKDINIPMESFPSGDDVDGKRMAAASRSREVMEYVGAEVDDSYEDTLYTAMQGGHMAEGGPNDNIIPDGAYMCVRLKKDKDIRSGSLVFAQVNDTNATAYMYYYRETEIGFIEEFIPNSRHAALRLVTQYISDSQALDSKRIIFGVVERLISVDIKNP